MIFTREKKMLERLWSSRTRLVVCLIVEKYLAQLVIKGLFGLTISCLLVLVSLKTEIGALAQPSNSATLADALRESRSAEDAIAAEILQANSGYLKGAFEQAAEGYHRVLSAGYSSFGLHFNLGNVSYRLGDKASALAHYRLAESDRPRNPEVKGNIDLLLTETGASARSVRQGWFDYVPWSRWAGSDELFLLLCICSGLAFIFSGLGRLMPDFRIGSSPGALSLRLLSQVLAAGLLIVSFASALGFQASQERNRLGARAVVKSPKTSVRSESSEKGVVLFELPQLAEVRVLTSYPYSEDHLGQTAEWYQVRFDGSLSGWVPAEALIVF